MSLLTDSMLAYTSFDNALKKVIEGVKDVNSNNYKCFYEGKGKEEFVPDFVDSVKRLNKIVGELNILLEDYVNELAEAEREAWEEAQTEIEAEYYQGE